MGATAVAIFLPLSERTASRTARSSEPRLFQKSTTSVLPSATLASSGADGSPAGDAVLRVALGGGGLRRRLGRRRGGLGRSGGRGRGATGRGLDPRVGRIGLRR